MTTLQQMIHEQFIEYSDDLKVLEKKIIRKFKAGEDYSEDVTKAAGLKVMKDGAVRMMARKYLKKTKKEKMEKQIKLLAAKMLEEASEEFSNHGCNDLTKEVLDLITDEKRLCEDMKKWNGDDDWPTSVKQIGDSSLMHYLSDKLKGIGE
jgi:hypothetical protein